MADWISLRRARECPVWAPDVMSVQFRPSPLFSTMTKAFIMISAKTMEKEMESTPQQTKPQILFQYRPPEDWALRNLRNRAIYLGAPANFNDPYDCRTPLYVPADLSREKFLRIRKVFGKKFRINFKGVPERELTYALNEQFKNVHARMRQKCGIACFSESNENLLMWSHYAGRGKGFCVAFDTGDDMVFADERVYPVIYSEKPVDANTYNMWAQGEYTSFVEVLRYKSKDWAYEKEGRLITEEKCEEFYKTKTLKAVYFGTEAEESTKNKIRAIVQEKYANVELRQGRLVKNEYKVVFDRLP